MAQAFCTPVSWTPPNRRSIPAFLVFAVLLFPVTSPAIESPPPRAADLLAQNQPKPAPPSGARGAEPPPGAPDASSRAEEWRRVIRALEPKELKAGKGWRLLGPGAGDPELSEERLRGTRDAALLLLLELQHEEAIRRLQLAGVPAGTIVALERDYAAVHACLERRFKTSGLPAVLEEARRSRAVLEALVYRLLAPPPARTTEFSP